jgi:hypothetical protein
MARFGNKGGGGRRAAPRVDAPVPVVLETISASYGAVLVDISFSGARLRGEYLPSPGSEVILLADPVEIFGTIAWSHSRECGVHFDAPLPSYQMALLQHDAQLTRAAGVTPEERQAIHDWASGLAR